MNFQENHVESHFSGCQADRPAVTARRKMHDALKWTPLFRAGSWLLICIVVCVFAWGRSSTSAGAFAIGVCG